MRRSIILLRPLIAGIFLTAIISSAVVGRTIYVDDNGPADFFTIQDAIDDAYDGDVVIVQPGTYTGDGNRDIDFLGKAITVRSIDPSDPNIVAATIIDCNGTEDDPHRGFKFHSGEGPASVLDGLMITNGWGPREQVDAASPLSVGGGIFCNHASPTILDCRIQANGAVYGGGIYLRDCNPSILGCMIIDNRTGGWPAGKNGAGICCIRSSPLITDCQIQNNSAQSNGGGVFCYYNSNPTITHCYITDNQASSGGALYIYWHSSPTVQHCTILCSGVSKYSAIGKDIYCREASPTITGCTIVNTVAGLGLRFFDNERAELTNCIIWGPEPAQMSVWGSVTVSYCDIRGDYPGTGNIDSDPCFVDPVRDNYRLSVTSPCVNTGDPSYNEPDQTDLDGNPRVVNDRVDIGAYENCYVGPLLNLSPTRLKMEMLEASTEPWRQNIRVSNVGTGSLDWSASYDCAWLDIQPSAGSMLAGSQLIVVQVDPSSMTAGIYECPVAVHADQVVNSPCFVDINVAIIGPIMSLSKDSFEFAGVHSGLNPLGQSLAICNDGGGILDWWIDADCPWLQVDPEQASAAARETSVVQITANIDGVPVGHYQCNLTIWNSSSHDAPPTIAVSLDVAHETPLHVPSDYPTIQAAIDEAVNGDTIIVADGTYTGKGNRDIDFLGKAITVKSENGPDNCVIDCQGRAVEHHRGFIFLNEEDADAVLSGLTITNGYALQGGAVFCLGDSSPTIKNCVIKNNTAIAGGGISTDIGGHSSVTIEQCIIVGNRAIDSGESSLINGNGGAIFLSGHPGGFMGSGCPSNICYPEIINCTIVDNTASFSGGGVCLIFSTHPMIDRTIIWNNKANKGDNLGFILPTDSCSPKATLFFSNIEGVYPETHSSYLVEWLSGNITDDPCFAEPGYWGPNDTPDDANDDFWIDGDYHLKSQAGRWDAISQSWVQDDVTSPCIDAGDPMSPIGLEPFPNDGRVNMGAYGGTVEASKSYFGEPVCETIVAGDINGDCKVDFLDLQVLVLHWLEENS